MEKRCTCTCHGHDHQNQKPSGAEKGEPSSGAERGDQQQQQGTNDGTDPSISPPASGPDAGQDPDSDPDLDSDAKSDSDSDSDSDSCCAGEAAEEAKHADSHRHCHCEHSAATNGRERKKSGEEKGAGEQCCECRAPPPSGLVEHEDIYAILTRLRIEPQASKVDRLARLPEEARVKLETAGTTATGQQSIISAGGAETGARARNTEKEAYSHSPQQQEHLSDDEELEFEDFEDSDA